MNRFLVAAAASGLLLSAALAADPPREASAILKEYASVKMPVVNPAKVKEPDYIRSYFEERKQAQDKQDALALELFQAHPDHPEVTELMVQRWGHMRSPPNLRVDLALEEMEKFLKDWPDSKTKDDVLYQRAAALAASDRPEAQKNEAIEEFIRAAPKDDRGAELLMAAAEGAADKEGRLKIYRRIVADYVGSFETKTAAGSIRQIEAIGKPFELSFNDAISGQSVSIKELVGKVVVIDFWATWCGPCVAEMPTMKELYAKYKPQGVEFIGVSLDSPESMGGLDKLKAFVKENGITWPQYYQGRGWESEFSGSWGISGIPTLFILDAEGRLYSTEAREELRTLIPELIKKRDG
jgi:thiol-disulfide isomerase/thioredoxin